MSRSFFGLIIIAAIFGTSILRDFQRDTTQILFTKPISKFAYLGGRWAGSFVTTVFAFSGLIFGEFLGALAPWADQARMAPTTLVVSAAIPLDRRGADLFLGSLFFVVAALTRRIFIVYLQGAAFFMLYLIGLGAFQAPRARWPFSGPAFLTRSAILTTTPSLATGRWLKRTPCSTPGRFMLPAACSSTTACCGRLHGPDLASFCRLASFSRCRRGGVPTTQLQRQARRPGPRSRRLAAVAAAAQPGGGEAALAVHQVFGARHHARAARFAHPACASPTFCQRGAVLGAS